MENISNQFYYFGNLTEIPLKHIFSETELSDSPSLALVCKRFSQIFLEKDIWKKIALQIGCLLAKDSKETGYKQIKNFVIDLKKEIRELSEELPTDIAEIVNSRTAPTFKQISLLREFLEYRLAKDKILFWQELGTQIDPTFQIPKYETFDEMLETVSGFNDWCIKNKNKLPYNTILNLSNKNLVSIPLEITHFTHISRLILTDNKISKIPSEIQRLTGLTTLSLNNNRISKIPPEIQHLPLLIILLLNKNQITEIPHELKNLKRLKIFAFLDNRISIIPSEIKNMPDIQLLTELPLDAS